MTLFTAEGMLTPQAPFDFALALAFLGDFSPALGEQQIVDGRLRKAALLDGQPVVFSLEAVGSVDAPALACTLFAERPIDDRLRALAEAHIRAFLSLDDDLRPFYDLGRDDAVFAPVIDALYGYHQVCFPTAFECAAWAKLSQRNHIPVASRMKAALAERYGGALEVDGVLYRVFPDAGRLAQTPPGALSETIRHGPKGIELAALAQAFDGADETWMREAPYDEVERWLRSIRGVGAWTAAFVLLRGLNRVEKLPPDEKRLLNAAAQFYGIAPEDEAMERVGARYGRYIGLWAHYLRVAQ